MEQKVLVVEDEPTLLDTLEYNLTRQGYAVCTAADGPTALPLTRSFDCAQEAPPARSLVPSLDAGYNVTSRVCRARLGAPASRRNVLTPGVKQSRGWAEAKTDGPTAIAAPPG